LRLSIQAENTRDHTHPIEFNERKIMGRCLGQLEVLSANIKELAGEEACGMVMQGHEVLTEKSKPVQVADWVKGAIQRLDETVDP
jgi:hypothetical protein